MIRLITLFIFLLTASLAFGQQTTGKDSALKAAKEDFYLSMDARSQHLIIPPPSYGLKIVTVKVFSTDGKELLSQDITDTEKSTSVDITNLLNGEYIVQGITADKVMYKINIFISR